MNGTPSVACVEDIFRAKVVRVIVRKFERRKIFIENQNRYRFIERIELDKLSSTRDVYVAHSPFAIPLHPSPPSDWA